MKEAMRTFKKKLEALRPRAAASVSAADFSRMLENAARVPVPAQKNTLFLALSSVKASIILSAAVLLALFSVLAVYPRVKQHSPKPKLESQIPDDRIPDRRNLRNVDLNAGHI